MLFALTFLLLSQAAPVFPSVLEGFSNHVAGTTLGRNLNHNINYNRRLPVSRAPSEFIPSGGHIVPPAPDAKASMEEAAAKLRAIVRDDSPAVHRRPIIDGMSVVPTALSIKPFMEAAAINAKVIADIAASQEKLRKLGELKTILNGIDKSGMNAKELSMLEGLMSIRGEVTKKETQTLLDASLKRDVQQNSGKITPGDPVDQSIKLKQD